MICSTKYRCRSFYPFSERETGVVIVPFKVYTVNAATLLLYTLCLGANAIMAKTLPKGLYAPLPVFFDIDDEIGELICINRSAICYTNLLTRV